MSEYKEQTAEDVQVRILHLLGIYPIVSPTMLQAGLGPYTKPAVWRPALEALISEGKVVESQLSLQTPADRYNTYTLLKLPHTEVKFQDAPAVVDRAS